MNFMFSLFAKPLGWVMYWIYQLVPSYFLALLIFTVAIRLVLFPLSISNQKSQADRARLAPRLERLQKKYAQDKQKMALKQQELYEKEGVKMTGGCLPMILQMLVLFSVIAVIYKPLTYIQDISADDLTACYQTVDTKYGKEGADAQYSGYYSELNLFKAIQKDPSLKDKMQWAIVDSRLNNDGKDDTLTLSQSKKAAWDAELKAAQKSFVDNAVKEAKQAFVDAAVDAAKQQAETDGVAFDEAKVREEAAKKFNEADERKKAELNFNASKYEKQNKSRVEAEATAAFEKKNAALFTEADQTLNTIVKTGDEFGIGNVSLLEQPWQDNITPNWLWLIAIASGVSALLSGMLSMKYSKAAMSMEQQQAAGCSNAMLYMMPIMSLIFSFTVPAGVAVYWIFSNLLAMVQTVILNAMWNPGKIRAQAEIEYQQRRQKRREDKERLKAARLAEQAAWQEEENKAKARAKGDITQKKSAASKATPAELPHETAEEVVETAGDNEEEATNE